jgi:hypothetical protein
MGSALIARATSAVLPLVSGEPEWSAYSGGVGRKFLRLDQFLKTSTLSPAERK